MPSIAVCAPGSSAARYSVLRERAVEDLVDERRLARPAHAGDGDERAERKRDVDVLQVVRARAADDDLAARRPAPRAPAPRSRAGPRRYWPVSDSPGADEQLLRQPLEHHVAAVLARAGPEIDQVVGRANRLLVVLDDEHGVAEVAQLARASRAAGGCRAGAGRSTARRARRARRSAASRSASRAGCAGLRRPRASRRCGRASDSRRRRRSGSAAARGSRAARGRRSAARARSARAPRRRGSASEIGRST